MATINPLAGPINYATDVQGPFEAALGGYKIGAGIAEVEAKRLESQRNEEARVQAQQRQQELADVINNPNSTAQDIFRVTAFVPKAQADVVTSQYANLSKENQVKTNRVYGQIYAALNSGLPDAAIKILETQSTAYRNSGQTNQADAADNAIELTRQNPSLAKNYVLQNLSLLPGGQELVTSINAQSELRAREAKEPIVVQGLTQGLVKTEAEIAKTKKETQNLSDRFALDEDKLQFEVDKFKIEQKDKDAKLEPDARKIVNDSSITSIALRESSRGLLDLANKFDAKGGGFGSFAKITEEIAKMTGRQDDFTRIRNEYTRIRNSEAIKALPPGVATDKDVQLALEGIPPATADAKFIASFLRGTAKLSQYQAAFEQSKADWVNETGVLGKAKRDIQIGDILVPKGTSFIEFGVANMKRLSEGVGQEVGKAAVPTRNYMNYGQPQQ